MRHPAKRNVGPESGGTLAERRGFDAGLEKSLFHLDTNLEEMEGIVKQPENGDLPNDGGIFTGQPRDDNPFDSLTEEDPAGGPRAWDAPDSWAVKRHGDDVVERLAEIDEYGLLNEKDDHTSYFVRVFRIDSTFATLSAGINTTAAELLLILGKKSFLQEDLNNYHIVMRKHDMQRQLEPGERPLAMQKRLLEQAGYTSKDRIEEIGREDNSYLCQFTFMPSKTTGGFYSLDKDPGFNKMSKFSHVDLSNRNLVTIPITLYQKAADIIALNLSRNLSLDIPKDFIQGCINLREIKYIGNECWRLPLSFSLASRLTYLDISNNRIEQLQHAQLDKLGGLVSLKMGNNKLSDLPTYFSEFKVLRNLHMASNNFSTFPECLTQMTSLVELDISFNSIDQLPDISNLTNLERFWATNNNLSGPLHDSFKDLIVLRELDVKFNTITNIDSVSQLPRLEQLSLSHNSVSAFEGSFPKLRVLIMDHCPLSKFDITSPMGTLTTLNLASGSLITLKDSFFDNIPNLTKLVLDKNQFVDLSPRIGRLRKLEFLSMLKNRLGSLPPTIGCLTELRYLNLRECNIEKLPSELWFCNKLETLNVSSNVLGSFPRQGGTAPSVPGESRTNGATPVGTPGLSTKTSVEELGRLEDFAARRPSQASGSYLSVSSSPSGSHRKTSVISLPQGARHGSQASKESGVTVSTRKDSNLTQRLETTFSGSLQNLYLADNRLEDETFRDIALLPELRVLNMSCNLLTEIPNGLIRRWPKLTELYLSGNELTSLPSDDLEEGSNLRMLYINSNRFQNLPAELCKVQRLAILDVGSNLLKYNVSNWPYDWNWNWNRHLKYLNFSGNKRLEIKPSTSYISSGPNDQSDLTNFNSLKHLRILGLMDVTLTIPSVPDQTEDRRVRTSASLTGSISYGMADALGRNEHLSTIDMLVPRFRGNDMEILIGMFDGQAMSSTGSKIAKFLQENFAHTLHEEMKKVRVENDETPLDALRRTFLSLNKDLAATANATELDRMRAQPRRMAGSQTLSRDDLESGAVATVLYLDNMDLYVANVGDCEAVLIQSNGQCRALTRKHDPAESRERTRIREAGGYVSRNGKLNDVLEVSRAFGYLQSMPSVIAAPHELKVSLSEQDEMIVIASRELWDYVTPDLVVDVARGDRADPMAAAQKLRDLAMAFGARNKIMVMIVGVQDIRKRERSSRFRGGHTLSMGPASMPEDTILTSKRGKRPKDLPNDSRLARLGQVEAPTGELAIVFTDIKNSTSMWETHPIAMRSAIQMHNELFRRELGIIGGYEVKTEGDAFMVSFSTPTAALLWCFTCQIRLLELPWPQEILENATCVERLDDDQNTIYRGLSVRMGVHWGEPVTEKDPITGRMDYFGPMVNRTARISGSADGGQVFVSTDFVSEIFRAYEYNADGVRDSVSSTETLTEDLRRKQIRRELRQLSANGFDVQDLGERKLKGLENPEVLYMMYPHALAGRLTAAPAGGVPEPPPKPEDENKPAQWTSLADLEVQQAEIFGLWKVALRLEMIVTSLQDPSKTTLPTPELAVLQRVKAQGGELTETELMNFIEQLVIRVEVS